MTKQIRVVIVGNSPLPIENTSRNYAPGIRTWHFAYSARDANCKVLVIGNRIPKSYDTNAEPIIENIIDDIEYCSVEPRLFEDKSWLTKKIMNFKPDCVVGVNTHPCSVLSELDLPVPFWADLNGAAMCEAQAKSFVYDDDSFVSHFFDMETKVLQKADIFSAVSESQGFMVIGELGMFGRLSKETMGYRFVRVIPNASLKGEYKHTKNVIRETIVPQDSFVVLYSGGYNTWTDVKTMFSGLEKSMSINQSIHFVSTGGQIEGHDEFTYNHFKEMIKKSKFKDRFHLCGWVSNEDLPNYYLEADLGIISDRYCYEAIFGARTRTQDWLRAGLPFVSTTLSEVTEYLVNNGLAYDFEQGNSDSLAKSLVTISKNKHELKEKSKMMKKILNEEFLAEKTFLDFKAWLKKPEHSPDHGKSIKLTSIHKIQESGSKKALAASWPFLSSFLRKIGLGKYEEKIKLWGFNFLYGNNQKNFKARFLTSNIPQLFSGQKHLISITVKNIGNVTWQTPKTSNNPVNLSYFWCDLDGNEIINLEHRSPLSKNVRPRQNTTFDIVVTTPEKDGDYILKFDLVKEHKFWFSEYDSLPFTQKVHVEQIPKLKKSQKISVIIVSYNSEKYIKQCLDSVINSSIPLEIIVIDNASTDKTLQILNFYEDKIKLIKSTQNLGFAGGNNLGIKNSSGDILILINPDAYVEKNSIEQLIGPMLYDERVMIAGPKIFYPDSKKIQSAGGVLLSNALPYHIGYGKDDDPIFNSFITVDYVTGAALAIKRTLFEITGLFDPVYNPAYYEETEKCVQARKLGFKVLYVPKSIVYHYESTTQIS